MQEAKVGLFCYPSLMKGRQLPEALPLGTKRIGELVIERASEISDRVIVVATDEEQANLIGSMAEERGMDSTSEVIGDEASIPRMVEAALGASERGSLLAMPSASPYIQPDVLGLMMELLEGREGVFLRQKDGSVYEFLFAVEAEPVRNSLISEGLPPDVPGIMDRLVRTIAISWGALSMLDPLHASYFLVRTDADYLAAKRMLNRVTKY